MVKGTSRRVIVVDSPDPALFEQAIFIVRKDALRREGVSSEQLLAEACRAARNYVRSHTAAHHRRLSSFACAVIGAGCIALLWLASTLW